MCVRRPALGQDDRMGNDRGPQPTLRGPRVRLRPWRPDDVDAVVAACQDPEIQRWTQVPVPYTREDAEGFVGGIASATWADGGALFAVEPRDGGPLAGSIGLFPPRDGVRRGRLLDGGRFPGPRVHRRRRSGSSPPGRSTTWACTGSSCTSTRRTRARRRVAERAGFSRGGPRAAAVRCTAVGPADVVLYARLVSDPRTEAPQPCG